MKETKRKRASLFGDDSRDSPDHGRKLNLTRFSPKKAAPLDTNAIETISEEAGFTTSHAPMKQKTTKRDGRKLKKSKRISQFNVRLKPQTADRFWAGAEKENYEYADDFLTHLLDLYEGMGQKMSLRSNEFQENFPRGRY